MGSFQYKAFLSYSHNDHRWVQWFHRRLETYQVPKHLRKGEYNQHLKPIFRDREELPVAHSLGEKIEQALQASENLIVVCSPDAAKSEWVNQEILSYKRHIHSGAIVGGKILCVIIEGEPFSGGEDECMPPALRFEIDASGELTTVPAEPLAADLRSGRDGKRLGLLKLISGMLDVGLDELVQRDMQRNRTRVTAITVGASSIVLAMSLLTTMAVNESKRADVARVEAEARKNDAEGLIEFMLKGLKPELESVGRLEPLSLVGEQAAQYYANQPLESHNDNALGRRARVFQYIGEIEDKSGNLDLAEQRFADAYDSTKVLLARDPMNPERIFEHAQSAYWRSYIPYIQGDYARAGPPSLEYVELAEALSEQEPDSLRGLKELGYAYTTLGTNYFKLKENDKAYRFFEKAMVVKTRVSDGNPNNVSLRMSVANSYAWLADTSLYRETIRAPLQHRKDAADIYMKLKEVHPKNIWIHERSLHNDVSYIKLLLLSGEMELAKNLAMESLVQSQKVYERDPENKKLVWPLILLTLRSAEIDLIGGDVAAAEKKHTQLLDVERALSEQTKTKEANFQRYLANRELLRIHILIGQRNFQGAASALDVLRRESRAAIKGDAEIEVYLMRLLLNSDCEALSALLNVLDESGGGLRATLRAQILALAAFQDQTLPSVRQLYEKIDWQGKKQGQSYALYFQSAKIMHEDTQRQNKINRCFVNEP